MWSVDKTWDDAHVCRINCVVREHLGEARVLEYYTDTQPTMVFIAIAKQSKRSLDAQLGSLSLHSAHLILLTQRLKALIRGKWIAAENFPRLKAIHSIRPIFYNVFRVLFETPLKAFGWLINFVVWKERLLAASTGATKLNALHMDVKIRYIWFVWCLRLCGSGSYTVS